MAKRQTTQEPRNVTRLDGEGKTHAEGRSTLTPLCGLRNHEDHTWVETLDDVDCSRCIKLEAKRSGSRERLEYAAGARDTQDDVYSQGALRDLDIMAKGEPPVIPAEVPVKAENGETVTVPVDYDNPSAGRRELDASKGERVIGESTFVRRPKVDPLAEMEALIARVRARVTAKMSADMVSEIVRQEKRGEFSPVFFEPKNGPALEVAMPPIPEGVHPHTWELAHQGNTEGARRYHMARAKEQEEAFFRCSHCGESNQYTMCPCISVGDSPELETPPF